MNPKKTPKFIRQGATAYKRLGMKWRKPRGRQSKVRERQKSHGSWPTIGYRAPNDLRFLHPSGMKEILICSMKDLEKVNLKTAVKISHTVGKRKREIILKKAKEMNLRILNE